MNNKEILNIALQQSAYDCNCEPEDFFKQENVVVDSKENKRARKYLPPVLECDLVSYGSNIVAQTSEQLRPIVENYINKYSIEHCFETPNLHVLDKGLEQFGFKVCFMAEYFLPDITKLKRRTCKYEMKLLEQKDFAELYTEQWSNALCEKRKELDILGLGAYNNGELIGLAACSADCEEMWQIGIDVLPEYRKQGIASALTSNLALEIIERGKIPFYCAAWSNIKSVRNAIKSGFYPAWVEVTAREKTFVEEMNQ